MKFFDKIRKIRHWLSIRIMKQWAKYVRYKEESFKGSVSRTLGGTNTSLTVSGWLVGKGKFTQVSADHIEFYFDWVEDFTVVNADNIAHHFWHNNAISKMGFDCCWLFTWLTVLLSLFAFIVEPVISVFDF